MQAGVNHLEEEDHAPLWLCPECVTKIVWTTENEYESRYEKLLAFCHDTGLDEDARFFNVRSRGCAPKPCFASVKTVNASR